MKTKHILILLLLPATIVFTAALLRHASGPYWISFYSDPEYTYLIKFLAMTEGKETLTIGHPGTTLQMLGAASIKIVHALNFFEKDNLKSAVLKNPEYYLNVVNIILIFLNAIMLFVIGILTFKLTKNMWLSLLLQFSPFFSNIILCKGLISVSPEALFIFCTMLFIMILIKMIHAKDLSEVMPWYIIALSIVCSFGMATKLTFGPLLIIPLIVLPGWRNKVGFLILTGVCFFFWIWPILSQYKILFEWYYRVLAHSGYYGHGNKEIINFSIYFQNIINLFLGNPLFCLILLFSIFFILRFRKLLAGKPPYKFLVAVTFAQLTAILVISKHGYDYYLLPVLNLSGFALFLIFLCMQTTGFLSRSNLKKVCILFVTFIVFCGLWRIVDMKKILIHHIELKQESLMIYQKMINEYSDYMEIIPLRASSPLGALSFGNYFLNNGLYSELLREIYGEKYFYNGLEGKFHTWTQDFLIEDLFFTRKIRKIALLSPAYGENVGKLCNTGSYLYFEAAFMGEYGAIYILKDVILKAGEFKKQSISPKVE